MTAWFARQRWWLLAVPVTLALLVVASGYRFKDLYWDTGYHHEQASGRQGSYVHVVDGFTDGVGPTRRTYDVRLDGLSQLSFVTLKNLDEVPPPDGADGVAVHLTFRAAPDQDLNYCGVWLVDDQGDRYGGDSTESPLDSANACVPEDHEGPASPYSATQRRGVVAPGHERPTTWSVSPQVLVPTGAKIVAVRLGFATPDYVTLRVR